MEERRVLPGNITVDLATVEERLKTWKESKALMINGGAANICPIFSFKIFSFVPQKLLTTSPLAPFSDLTLRLFLFFLGLLPENTFLDISELDCGKKEIYTLKAFSKDKAFVNPSQRFTLT